MTADGSAKMVDKMAHTEDSLVMLDMPHRR